MLRIWMGIMGWYSADVFWIWLGIIYSYHITFTTIMIIYYITWYPLVQHVYPAACFSKPPRPSHHWNLYILGFPRTSCLPCQLSTAILQILDLFTCFSPWPAEFMKIGCIMDSNDYRRFLPKYHGKISQYGKNPMKYHNIHHGKMKW